MYLRLREMVTLKPVYQDKWSLKRIKEKFNTFSTYDKFILMKKTNYLSMHSKVGVFCVPSKWQK